MLLRKKRSFFYFIFFFRPITMTITAVWVMAPPSICTSRRATTFTRSLDPPPARTPREPTPPPARHPQSIKWQENDRVRGTRKKNDQKKKRRLDGDDWFARYVRTSVSVGTEAFFFFLFFFCELLLDVTGFYWFFF